MKIPKSFKLFGTTYTVIWDNKRMNDMKNYGVSDYSKSEITLSDKIGDEKLSNDKIMDTYYHERTHAILDMMNERDISLDEKFVDVFSKLLRQADESSVY